MIRTDNPNNDRVVEMYGQVFGELTAVSPSRAGWRYWVFRCPMGHEVQRVASAVRARAKHGHAERCPTCIAIGLTPKRKVAAPVAT